MIRKSMIYQKKLFDLMKTFKAIERIGDIQYIIINKMIEENEIEEITLTNAEDIINVKFPEKIVQLIFGLNDETIIVIFYGEEKLRISISAESRDAISELKDILEEELQLDRVLENSISKFEQMRKKNSSNPEWIENLIEKLGVWIELRDKELYLDGSFSADELIYIANEMNKKIKRGENSRQDT